jgi:hypothetical protein
MLNENTNFRLPDSGRIIMPFAVEAAVASLPVFCASPGQASILDKLIEFLVDGNYQLIIRACPTTQQQANSNVFLANQSYEDQISVPTGSFLTMIGGIISGDTDHKGFRVQFYDAGAQAQISDGYVHSNTISGRYTQLPQTGQGMLTTVSADKNLFILPSPLSITSPGQLNVQITNLNGQTATIDMAFFFAAPFGSNLPTVNGAIIGNAVSK